MSERCFITILSTSCKNKRQILQNDNVSSSAPKQASSDSAVSCTTLISNKCHIINCQWVYEMFEILFIKGGSKQSCSYKLVTARDLKRLEGGLMCKAYHQHILFDASVQALEKRCVIFQFSMFLLPSYEQLLKNHQVLGARWSQEANMLKRAAQHGVLAQALRIHLKTHIDTQRGRNKDFDLRLFQTSIHAEYN